MSATSRSIEAMPWSRSLTFSWVSISASALRRSACIVSREGPNGDQPRNRAKTKSPADTTTINARYFQHQANTSPIEGRRIGLLGGVWSDGFGGFMTGFGAAGAARFRATPTTAPHARRMNGHARKRRNALIFLEISKAASAKT